MRQHFSDSTFSLAKSLHHINLAKDYLMDVRMGTSGSVKELFNGYISKCEFILNNINDRLKEENREALKKELKNSFTFEAINDKLIYLDDAQREDVENYIENLIRKQKESGTNK